MNINQSEHEPQTNVSVPDNTGTVNISKAGTEPMAMIYIKLGIPAIFSLIIIGTCVYKIVTAEQEQPELRAVYWSTMASTAASWLPSAASVKRTE